VTPSRKLRAWIRMHAHPSSVAIAAVIVLTGSLILSNASSQAFTKVLTRDQAASNACASYVSRTTTGVNPPTVLAAYSTNAGNLESWIRTIVPMADPSVLQGLSPITKVTDCVLKWHGPTSYTAVLIAPHDNGTTLLSGPSTIAQSAPAG
jgi:hypothetical protein